MIQHDELFHCSLYSQPGNSFDFVLDDAAPSDQVVAGEVTEDEHSQQDQVYGDARFGFHSYFRRFAEDREPFCSRS